MISRALASLGPSAMAIATPLNPDQPILPPDTDASEGDEGEGLVEYEGMLVSASAAQRRRSCAHSDVMLMNERKRLHLFGVNLMQSQVSYWAAQGQTDVSC